MGAFYGSIQVRTEDREPVLEAVGKLSGRLKTPMLVGPVLRGWVGVYPAGNGQDENVSRLLGKRIPGELIHLIVHDDDFFTYCYYRDGKVIDRFNSNPDYFTTMPSRARSRVRGRPERLAHLLADPGRLDELRSLLAGTDNPPDIFASRSLEQFADLLGMANAAQAYEYLREADGEGVEGWEQFTHLPDLSEERGRKLAAEAERAAQMQRLRDRGTLRHVESRLGTNKQFAANPLYCPDGSDGFLVYWGDWQAGEPRPLEHYQPPWQSPGRPTGIQLDPTVHCLARSPSGRYFASGHAYGDWNARLWDLTSGRLIRAVGHDRAVLWAGFSGDDDLLVTLGNLDCQITRTATGDLVAAPAIPNGKAAAIHPDGTLVVADEVGRLHLVDLATGAIHRTLLLGVRAQIDALRQMQRSVLGYMLQNWDTAESRQKVEESIQQLASRIGRSPGSEGGPAGAEEEVARFRQQLEAMQESMRRQRADLESGAVPQQGSERAAAMSVSHDGRQLAVATSRGVRVYEWDAVRAARDYLPDPMARFDSIRGPAGGETNYAYGLAWHPSGTGVVFGGMDGRIDYLDVNTGEHRVLCEIPGRVDYMEAMRTFSEPVDRQASVTAVLSLALSTDGSSLACCVLPDFLSRDRVRKPPELMLWDYAELERPE